MRATRLLAPLVAVCLLFAVGCDNPEMLRSIQLTNQEREARGIAPVTDHPTLRAKAQSWAELLADRETGQPPYLTHSNLAEGAGTGWRLLGENLALSYNSDHAHEMLMASPGHRANILNGSFRHVGVGAAYSVSGMLYVVQVFGG